jgi:hypothetical protein
VELEVKATLVWKRLGVPSPGAAGDAALRADFDSAYRRARDVLTPRWSSRRVAVIRVRGDEVELDGGVAWHSADLAKLTSGASTIVAMAATVGEALEALAADYDALGEVFAMTVADAVGSVAAEELVSRVHRRAREEGRPAGEVVGRRISPGYGDFDLACQAELLALSGGTELGITLTENYMMMPRKSVSAVAAITAE